MRLLLLPALLAVAACSAAAPGELGQAIVNGSTDVGDPAVVMLVRGTGTDASPWCSGEVVSPHVVLTAAHCVPSLVSDLEIFTGTTLTMSSPASEFLAVAGSKQLPAYDSNSGKGDVGVVILQEPTTIAPIRFNHFPLRQGPSGLVGRVVGYGIASSSDNANSTAGTRRQAPMTLDIVNPDDTISIFDDMHSVCFGDSGGPSLFTIDGRELITGLSHEVFIRCVATMGASATRPDLYAEFVDGYIEQYDPPAIAGGDSCASDGDCGPWTCGDTSVGKICEEPCDPSSSNATSCPMGTACYDIDGKHMCARHGAGCALAGGGGVGGAGGGAGASGVGVGALALVIAALLLLALRVTADR